MNQAQTCPEQTTQQKKKICVVANTPLSIQFFFKSHLQRLAQHAEVTLVLNPDNDPYVPPLNLPIRVLRADIQRKISIGADCLALFQLFKLFRQEQFDLVWATAPKAGLLGMGAAWLARIPRRVFVFQGEVWATSRGLKRQVLKLADYLTARLATHLLAVSPSERAFLDNEGVAPLGKVTVLGAGSISGVDLDRYCANPQSRQAIRNGLGIPQSAVVALFMGRLVGDKGIKELAEAFKTVADQQPDLWLLIVGPDEEQCIPDLMAQLGSAAARARFAGFTPTPEHYMAAADFLCLPSHREGFGMVIVEAAATGIPAIGSRIYGISDAIQENKTGLLFQVKDPSALAAAITIFCRDPALRLAMGAQAQSYVKRNFDHDIVVGRYVDYLMSCMNNHWEYHR